MAEWNVVRLAPTFMLSGGRTPYPGLADGALTTWIYGPLPLLTNLPARFAGDTAAALLIAAAINLAIAVLPLAIAIRILARESPPAPAAHALWPLLLAVALWPNAHLQYFQADNAAMAATLLSMVCLQTGRGRAGLLTGLAAFFAAAATWCKQPYLLIIPAQLVWLAITADRAAVRRYTGQCAIMGLSMAGLFVAWFGWDPLWLNLVLVPGQLPWTPEPVARLLEMKWHLVGWLLLPLIGALVWRRPVWSAHSRWLLPALIWLALLPLGLSGALRVGGASNALAGGLVFLPALTLWGYQRLHVRRPAVAPLGAAGLIALIVGLQISHMPVAPLTPRTQHLREATQIAESFPQQVYFPWHPLITWFSEGRFDHAEDGLYTRQVAGVELPRGEELDAFLPPHWHVTAIPGWRHQGVYTDFQPDGAQMGKYGNWSLYLWELAPPPPAPATSVDAD